MRLNDETGVEPERAGSVARGIVRVPLRTPTLPPATRTNAYLVRGRRGLWIVDPGSPYPEEQAHLHTWVSDTAERWEVPVCGVILTHHHPDHIGGLGAYSNAPGLTFVADRRSVELMRDQDIGVNLQWSAFDGDGVIDGLALVFTPGHAPGHLALWTSEGSDELAGRVLMAGDLVSGIGTIVVNPPRGNMSEYLSSLERAEALKPALLLPAHGPGTSEAVERLQDYRSHRLAREAKVLAAFSAAAALPLSEITSLAYDDVPASLHGWAERSVLAHLDKLIADGEVARVADAYRRIC